MNRTEAAARYGPRGKVVRRRMAMVGLVLCIAFAATALTAPTGWVQMTETNGLGAPPTDSPTELFTFDGGLFAYNDYGLFRMQLTPCLRWEKLGVPTSPGSWKFVPIGATLYLHKGSNELYMITAGAGFAAGSWKAIASQGTPNQDDPQPLAVFGGDLYAVYYPAGSGTFEIWRSSHTGLGTMTWTRVVQNGFGDPQNHALGFLTVFNGKLIAATTQTRTSMFGDPGGFQQGVEVWESPSGDPGTWKQVNVDGFGTQITQVGTSTVIRTNMDVGAHAIYNGALYVGTKSHYGAEVWRYDGSGLGGWTDVTPSWAGPSPLMSMPGRNLSMVVYGGELYLAEGYSTGNLAKTSGGTWSVVVSGPNPFLAENGGIASLAVLDGRLYAATLHAPYAGTVVGDQVWGTPFDARPTTCLTPKLPDLSYDPPLIRYRIVAGLVELAARVRNGGEVPTWGEYTIGVFLGREQVAGVDGPRLDPGEEAEVRISVELPPGEHALRVVLDPDDAVMEGSEENNAATVDVTVPGAESDGETTPISSRVGRVSMRTGSESVCESDGASHLVHVEWQADTTARLRLEVVYPDLRLEMVELPVSSGEIDVPVSLPEGGTVRVNLVIPGVSEPLIGADVMLFPC